MLLWVYLIIKKLINISRGLLIMQNHSECFIPARGLSSSGIDKNLEEMDSIFELSPSLEIVIR